LQRSLDNILTVLRPGGKLIVRVPYREELDAYVLHEQRFDFLHVRNFDEFSLRLLLEKAHACSFVEMDLAGGRWMSRFLLVQRLCHLGATAVNRLSPSLWSRIPLSLITPYELGMVFERRRAPRAPSPCV
jgi:SAM-dependent methyltransferase